MMVYKIPRQRLVSVLIRNIAVSFDKGKRQ